MAQDTTAIKTEKKVQAEKHGRGFVDKNGDGFNDNAPDDDGDGIPNGLDPDYICNKNKMKFIDLDGDGINDYLQNRRFRNQKMKKGNTTLQPQSAIQKRNGQKNTGSGGKKRRGKGKSG